ncbi:integral membrane protein, partial [Moniliophthora roreri]
RVKQTETRCQLTVSFTQRQQVELAEAGRPTFQLSRSRSQATQKLALGQKPQPRNETCRDKPA